jgi:Xaa-Pro aminopeptidase
MDKGSLAVIHSNDIMPTNTDGTHPFRQNNDLYWLTGIRQEETTLVIFPDHPDLSLREILFIKYVDEQFVKWYGRRHSLDEASTVSGVKNVQ